MKTDPGWEPIEDESPLDPSGLLLANISCRAELNQAEAENIAPVAVKYLVGRLTNKEAPFSFDWVFALHKEMFGNVWDWAGKARTYDINLGCRFYDVEAQVLTLVQDLAFWGKGGDRYPIIEDAAMLHYRAVKIHPFLNGNGRWSRMLANIWLHKHGQRPIQWPEPKIGVKKSPIREEYVNALKAADRNEFSLFNELHRRFQQKVSACQSG